MTVYARLCGWTLARAHARSGDRIALAAYLGGSDRFDQAIAGFAETYADQNERDYAALQAAVKEGKVEATTEILTRHHPGPRDPFREAVVSQVTGAHRPGAAEPDGTSGE